jgi:aerobic-type carbon monoxide dehydrogenase small subunit (CoxS/CutS family)
MLIQLSVNGRRVAVDVDAGQSLLTTLRDDLALTGAKYGCGEGQCGACSVLLDGKRVFACQTPVGTAAGTQVTTIEGLERAGMPHPLQRAFMEENAMQCGYCTPGMIMAGVALLNANPDPSHDDIVRAMNGNVCRCGAYPQIVAAIQRASREMHGKAQPEQRTQEQRP